MLLLISHGPEIRCHRLGVPGSEKEFYVKEFIEKCNWVNTCGEWRYWRGRVRSWMLSIVTWGPQRDLSTGHCGTAHFSFPYLGQGSLYKLCWTIHWLLTDPELGVSPCLRSSSSGLWTGLTVNISKVELHSWRTLTACHGIRTPSFYHILSNLWVHGKLHKYPPIDLNLGMHFCPAQSCNCAFPGSKLYILIINLLDMWSHVQMRYYFSIYISD